MVIMQGIAGAGTLNDKLLSCSIRQMRSSLLCPRTRGSADWHEG